VIGNQKIFLKSCVKWTFFFESCAKWLSEIKNLCKVIGGGGNEDLCQVSVVLCDLLKFKSFDKWLENFILKSCANWLEEIFLKNCMKWFGGGNEMKSYVKWLEERISF
jgi:hypothetical protein